MYTIGNQSVPFLFRSCLDGVRLHPLQSYTIAVGSSYAYDCDLVYFNILELASKLRPIIVLKGIYFMHDLLGHDTGTTECGMEMGTGLKTRSHEKLHVYTHGNGNWFKDQIK
jgi:hypothetical protein